MTQLAFGDFVLDAERRRLATATGEAVPLSPRLFDALLFFVERAGELLDKDTLFKALWPGLVVEESSLSQLISALRKALGDDAQQSRYLQTVPRRGFRFIAPVVAVAPVEPVVAVEAALQAEPQPSPPEVLPPSAVDTPPRPASRRRVLIAAGAGVAVAAAGASAWWWRQRPPPPSTGTTTLAVLPFKPLVVEARDELLEIGMADSLVTRLSSLPGVAVRSLGSVRRFAGPDQDVQDAARELNVQWIVDGSIQRWGEKVRVTARLLDTATGEAAWSGNFDEPFTGVFDLQDAISKRVAEVLAPRLRGGALRRLEQPAGTRNVDAYQLYLAGLVQSQSIRSAALRRSIELFTKATVYDPRYALAYVGIAEAHRRTIFGADAEPRLVFPASDAAANQALAIDGGVADAHASLGWNRFWHDWDWKASEALFRRAVDLNPNAVSGHFGYGQLLDAIGRTDESIVQMRLARELDPLSLITLTLEASSLYGSGKRVEGRQRLERVFEIEPEFWVAHLALGSMLIGDQDIPRAIESYERANQLADGSSQPAAALGYVLARRGSAERARAIADALVARSRDVYVPPTSYGAIYAGLGDKAAALDALEKALEVRDVRLTLMRGDQRWIKSVGEEPRYRAVMKRMALDG